MDEQLERVNVGSAVGQFVARDSKRIPAVVVVKFCLEPLSADVFPNPSLIILNAVVNLGGGSNSRPGTSSVSFHSRYVFSFLDNSPSKESIASFFGTAG